MSKDSSRGWLRIPRLRGLAVTAVFLLRFITAVHGCRSIDIFDCLLIESDKKNNFTPKYPLGGELTAVNQSVI